MHKKPLIAVLIIGLLLLTGNAFAAQDEDVFVRVQSPPLDKGALNLVNKGVEPLTAIQGGTPRVVPGTFCTVDWTGGFTGYYYGDMVWAGETYIVYQDVDIHSAGCAGLPNNYTFDVTAVNFIPCNDYPGATYWLQPVVYGVDLTDPICPQFPGPLSCAGPIYAFTLPLDQCYGLNLAFAIECCVPGPYFAGIYCPAQDENLGVGIDYTGPVALKDCHLFNNYGGGPWGDVYDWGIVANFLISSEGFTPDDLATHCTPGDCDYQFYYPGVAPGSAEDGWNAGYGLRSGQYGGRDKLGVRFEAIGLDTVKSVGFHLYGPWTTDPAPDILVEVWDDGGAISNCGYNTPGATPVYSTVVPGASLVFYPAHNVTLLPDLTFGTLNGGPIDEFFITISTTQASHDAGLATGFACYDPGIPGCQTGDMRSLAFYPNYDPPFDDPTGDLGPTWVYLGGRDDAATSAHCEFVMEATICAEKIPIVEVECGPGSTDEWPTFGHDYQNTSASSINVGDPNGIKLEWSVQLGSDMSFCNPTVAGDVVYASSSDRLEAFNLATGAPVVGSPFTGIPEMGTSNRANTTIHGGFAYVTGGNFAALSKLPAGDLQKTSMLWSNNAMTMADMAEQNRFGCAMVIDGLDIVLVLTEPIQNPGLQGELFAFNNADGTLYGGWGTNPVLLDKAARHGPSYDGTYLYVATGDADLTAGSIWCIDPATGAAVWQFMDNTIDPANPGGFPGGVSVDGDFLYAVSADANTAGRRFCIDKSAGTAAVVWATGQGSRSLYGSPTIGRNFIYVPYDNQAGIGMIDKAIGLQVHNFLLQGVDAISQHVTLSCDNILFAGDRQAKWWCLNANTLESEFYRQYPVPEIGIVNATALASHSTAGDFAVVGIRYDGVNGRVSAYKLGTGARPRLEQYAWDNEILVPLGAVGSDATSIVDIFENIGDADMTMGPGSVTATTMAASVNRPAPLVTDPSSRVNPKYRPTGMSGEWPIGVNPSTQKGSSRSDAYTMASATVSRTELITLNGGATAVVAPGGFCDLEWTYSLEGLGRGIDVEEIVVQTTDPDFDVTPGSSVASVVVTYIGGCPEATTQLLFNAADPGDAGHHLEMVYNYGALGRDNGEGLFWDDDPLHQEPSYDGGIFILGDSAIDGGAVVRADCYDWASFFVPNVRFSDGTCGFDGEQDIPLGYYLNGGLPVEVRGEWVQTNFSDTDFVADPASVQAAIGIDVVVTEVGAYDPFYGDFKVVRIESVDRYGNGAGPLYVGSFFDWDVNNSSNNSGNVSDMFNGYAIWDGLEPSNAYGVFDLDQPQGYDGVDPVANSPHSIRFIDNPLEVYNGGLISGPTDKEALWHQVVNGPTRAANGPFPDQDDKSGWVFHQPFTLGPYGSHAVHMAVFGADATSNDWATVEANVAAIAARAARWAGFARGNVNEDGLCDLGDVWYLNQYVNGTTPPQLYPDTYCGDVDGLPGVDQLDVDYLFAWVTGLGDAPVGAWRF